MKIIVTIAKQYEYVKGVEFACDNIYCVNALDARHTYVDDGDKCYIVSSALSSTVNVRIADEYDHAPDVKTAAANCDFITVEETV